MDLFRAAMRDTIAPMMQELAELLIQNSRLSRDIVNLTKMIATMVDRPTPTAPAPTKPTHQEKTLAPPAEKGKSKGRGKETEAPKSYVASAATTSDRSEEEAFIKVNWEKKKKSFTPFLNPEYSRLNRQVIVETSGPILEDITSDNIL